METARPVDELSSVSAEAFAEIISNRTEPVLLRGLVAEWPAVDCALRSADAVDDYLQYFYKGATVDIFRGEPAIEGRFFYDQAMTSLNFQRLRDRLDVVLAKLKEQRQAPDGTSIYVGSTTIDTCLPGFRDENKLDFGELDPLASIWIGNRSRVAAHYDFPDNIACVVAGKRRFTLYPPEQLPNLYVGPLDFTPAGQQISLVDSAQPDLEQFPRFAQAMANAQVAEMAPGDALFVPSMWWHQVESLDEFNVLVNYWWRSTPDYMGNPTDVLYHALLTLRGLPTEQRRAWEGILDYYVFSDDGGASHLPEDSRGILGDMDETRARQVRAQLLNRLNR